MRSFRIGSLLLFAVLVPLLAFGQSLGSVAKKERERREKNKEQGVEAHEFTQEEVAEADDAPSEASGEDEESVLGDAPDSPGGKESAFDRESQDRRRSEAEWRGRFKQARDRVAQARQRVEFFSGLSLTHGERYVDAQGNTVIGSLDELKRMVAEANGELSDAEKALQDLEDEARRAGVPPGWRR